jgi:hypothetical protein
MALFRKVEKINPKRPVFLTFQSTQVAEPGMRWNPRCETALQLKIRPAYNHGSILGKADI